MITLLRRITFIIVCLAIVSEVSFAHHSVAGFFDPQKKSEIEGIVKKVRWRNPHTVFEVDVTNDAGEVVTWRIESGALGVLRQRGALFRRRAWSGAPERAWLSEGLTGALCAAGGGGNVQVVWTLDRLDRFLSILTEHLGKNGSIKLRWKKR